MAISDNKSFEYDISTTVAANNEFDISVLPYQSKLLFSKKPILAFIGGTGCGKSFFIPIWLWYKMLQFPGEEWIVSSPTIPMMKRTVVKYIKSFFDKNSVVYTYNKADFVFDLPHGTIYCISAQDPDRMQGIHAKGIIGDEAGLYDRLWWETALQRVSFKEGLILLTTTPYYFNYLKTDIYDRWLTGDKSIEFVNPTSLDNPFYSKKAYEEAKKKLPEWKFKMLYEGKFARPEGLIYPEYTTVDPFDIPDDWEYVIGVDFGWNDPTAICVMRIDPDGNEYLVNEEKRTHMTIGELSQILQSFPSGTRIEADPSDKQIIYTLKEDYNLAVNSANNNVFGGIMALQEKLKTQKLKIFKSCKFVIDEVERYTWELQKDQDNMTDQPKKRGQNIHLLDALRYISTRSNQNYRIRMI